MFFDEPRKCPLRHSPLTRNDSQTLRLEPTNRVFGMVVGKQAGTAEMLASMSGGLNPPPLPLSKQFPLELRQPRHHGKYETAGWRAGVDPEIENAEMNATPLQVFDQQENIRRGSTETADFRDRERVTEREGLDQFVQKRAFRDAGNLLDHNPGRTGAAKGIDLSILGLIGGRDAGIPHEIDGSVTIHQATLFCHLPFVTNKAKPGCRLLNSGKRYSFCLI